MNMTGMLAKSLAGHDKNQIFVIMSDEGEYVYLADGKTRTICRMKKKKKIHIQLIKRQHDIEAADDAKLRFIIRSYCKSRTEEI